MNKDEIADNLGTIARSGSKKFVEELKEKDANYEESIIG